MKSDRTGTAKWNEKEKRWKITAQKNGVRKQFYSSTPGRTGQREANAKADEWLMYGGGMDTNTRCDALIEAFLGSEAQRASLSQMKKVEGVTRLYISPTVGRKKVSALTLEDFQGIVDDMI